MAQGTLTVSGIGIEPVSDGWSRRRPGTILIAPPDAPGDWERRAPWSGERWELPMGGFLVRTAGHLVLVDVGMGPMHVPGHVETGGLPESLAAAGARPADVTDVVLTHLHRDHVGWLSTDGVPTFSAARHFLHADDWANVRREGGEAERGLAEIVLPVSDLMHPVAGARSEVAPGVTLRHLPGHTAGNCLVDVGAGEDRALLLGDTAHHPTALVEDGWLDHFDADRDRARRVRAELADELESTGVPAVGAHFAGFRFGRVVRDRRGSRRWSTEGEGLSSTRAAY
jgi:glyoxylase-like metal-dependent hydrolase (beta-lactamase superfamily II)